MKKLLSVIWFGAMSTSAFALTAADQVKINEIYFAGSASGETQDGFIELYNAGDQAAFLDGALLLQGPDTFAQIAFKIPGIPGESHYPLAPGMFTVIAIDAHDFSQDDPRELNLSGATFETYWMYEADPGDNVGAVNLINIMDIPFEWFLEAEQGQVLLATGEEWSIQLCDTGGNSFCEVPLEEIVDGVEYIFDPSSGEPILRDEIDSGVIAGIAPQSGQSAERILPGHESDDSSLDFVIRPHPSPGYQTSLAAEDMPTEIAHSLQFDAIYPNPFNSETRISFKLPQSGYVQLVVLDILGNPVQILLSGRMEAGVYEVPWNGMGKQGMLPTGAYFVRLTTASGEAVSKVILSPQTNVL